MKIYIDWEEAVWTTDEEQAFDDLVGKGCLKTYSDFLADEFEDRYDELLDLSKEDKKNLHERYEMDLALEFEEKVRYGRLNYSVLAVETKDNTIVKEIL